MNKNLLVWILMALTVTAAAAQAPVERSKKRVVLILNGVHGPLQWTDLQTSGAVIPLGVKPDDPVEFIVAMDRQ